MPMLQAQALLWTERPGRHITLSQSRPSSQQALPYGPTTTPACTWCKLAACPPPPERTPSLYTHKSVPTEHPLQYPHTADNCQAPSMQPTAKFTPINLNWRPATTAASWLDASRFGDQALTDNGLLLRQHHKKLCVENRIHATTCA